MPVSADDFTTADPQRLELSDGAAMLYVPGFIKPTVADALYRELVEDTPWDTNVTGNVGRPRQTFWVGDFPYAYSGVVHQPAPWTPTLDVLRTAAESLAFDRSAGQFRGVLINLYRSGADSIGFHSDDEPEIEPESPIASVSLGAERVFILKPKKKRIAPDKPEVRIPLGHGSCLVMCGRMQRDWRHGIPAEPHVVGGRVNLTFRKYILPA